jgi:hypothetical protein
MCEVFIIFVWAAKRIIADLRRFNVDPDQTFIVIRIRTMLPIKVMPIGNSWSGDPPGAPF